MTIDLNDRLKSIGELEKNIVVLAGAGTGKTSLLIDRLALLILGKGLPVEKIVALTFTKKAAEEMRERLEDMLRTFVNPAKIEDIPKASLLISLLHEKYQAEQGLWPSRAEKALEDLPKAQIGTIHSFAGYLLRLYPLQGKVDPGFFEDEGDRFEMIFETAWARWISNELIQNSNREPLWMELLKDIELEHLKTFAQEISSPRVNLEQLQESVDLETKARACASELADIVNANPLKRQSTAFPVLLEGMKDAFLHFSSKEPLSNEIKEKIEREASIPASWKSVPGLELKFKKLSAFAKGLANVNEALIAKSLKVLKPFIEELRSELHQTGLVTFDGSLIFARNLLRDHPVVRKALKAKFETFLIDEFQDTDPVQGEILFYLSETLNREASIWNQVQLAPGRLFIVGDPQQSIYRFRGADVAAFEAFQKVMTEQGALVSRLVTNFRSRPGLIDFVNHVTPTLMKAESGVQPAYTPLACGTADSDDPEIQIERWSPKNNLSKLRANEARLYEGKLIADWIQSYCGQKGSAGRKYSDVALLFRSTNGFRPYLDALRQADIPFVAEGEKFFYHTPEVIEFLNLLSAIADPGDALSLVGILRSPLGGLTDREIWELKKAGGLDFRISPPLFQEKIGTLFHQLKNLSRVAFDLPVSQLIDELFAETWLLPLLSAGLLGEQAVANLQKIRRLSEKWSQEGALSLRTFINRFKHYREDEKEEGENPLADVKFDAVKVMTIHKAKGLEFPVLILPDLRKEGRAPSWDPPRILFDWKTGQVGLRMGSSGITNGAMVLIENENRRKNEAEEVRVFYVALTRVKNTLVLPIQKNGKIGAAAQYLKTSGVWPDDEQNKILFGDREFLINETEIKPQWMEKSANPRLKQKGKTLSLPGLLKKFKLRDERYLQISNQRLVLSPTAKLKESDKNYFVENDQDRVPLNYSQNLGLICHKVLENWDFESTIPPPEEIIKQIISAGRLFGLSHEDTTSKSLILEAVELLSGFFQTGAYQELKTCRILGRELPFLYPLDPKTEEGSKMMRGIIDILYERDGKLIVGDYKTTRLGGLSLKQAAEHYRPQGEAYKKVVQMIFKKPVEFQLIFLREGKSFVV